MPELRWSVPASRGSLSSQEVQENRLEDVCVCAMSIQSCPIPCDPMDCSPSGSSDHGLLQGRALEWVAMSFSKASSRPRDRTWSLTYLTLVGGLFTTQPPGKPPLLRILFYF